MNERILMFLVFLLAIGADYIARRERLHAEMKEKRRSFWRKFWGDK